MCGTCGCGQDHEQIDRHGHDHDHAHGHAHETEERRIAVELDLLANNRRHAEANRAWFRERGILALNFMASPGAGKTELLAATIRMLSGRFPVCVIEGDQQTGLDAARIREAGARAHQINTGKLCHLDAHMVGHAVEALQPEPGSLLLIENVGNLVCPAAFDLGEQHRVVMLSVTEGEDKPLKYPDMFATASSLVVNKCDLLPYVNFDVAHCLDHVHRVHPELMPVHRTSATTGEGLAEWCEWIAAAAESLRGPLLEEGRA
ncbi:MAG TPA: hydrogenase nickel incorporation protein HypB [Mariprofundaceae bacterium]|nr:hydrogenase nickel incorporation protein HypB [Mariprofundaceae bacterium]